MASQEQVGKPVGKPLKSCVNSRLSGNPASKIILFATTLHGLSLEHAWPYSVCFSTVYMCLYVFHILVIPYLPGNARSTGLIVIVTSDRAGYLRYFQLEDPAISGDQSKDMCQSMRSNIRQKNLKFWSRLGPQSMGRGMSEKMIHWLDGFGSEGVSFSRLTLAMVTQVTSKVPS